MTNKLENNLNVMEDVERRNSSLRAVTVEEALAMTGFGKYNYLLLVVCSWTLQAMGLDLFGGSFTVAAATCDLGLTLSRRGLLTATPLLGVVLGSFAWGYLSDTRGRRSTLTYSMAAGFAFAALGCLAPDWRSFMVLKLLSSTFTSASNSGAYTLLGESCGRRARARALLLCTCALMCAHAVAAVFAYPILPLQFADPIPFLGIEFRPWRLLVLVLALPCAATAFLLQFFHESPKFLATRGRNEDALKVLQSIYAINSGDKADNFPVVKLLPDTEEQTFFLNPECSLVRALWEQIAALFRPPLLKRTLQLFYLVSIIYMTGSGFIMWLPYVMNRLFLTLDAGEVSVNFCTLITAEDGAVVGNTTAPIECNDEIQETTLLSAMTYGALVTGASLLLSLAGGSHKRIAMMCVLATSAISAVLLNLVASPIAGGVFFFFFMMCALSMGLLSVYFVELYPTSLRGMASCVSVLVGRSSAFLGVNAIGALLTHHCHLTFYVWSLLLLSTIVFAWFLPKDRPIKT